MLQMQDDVRSCTIFCVLCVFHPCTAGNGVLIDKTKMSCYMVGLG